MTNNKMSGTDSERDNVHDARERRVMTGIIGIDSGAITNAGGFAWFELTAAVPAKRMWKSVTHDPERLVDKVEAAILNGPVVIAVEAPLWVPADPYTLTLGPRGGRSWSMGYRFPAEAGYEWYMGGATGVTINALTILAYLFGQLTARSVSAVVTDRPDIWTTGAARILLCETFLPPERKLLIPSTTGGIPVPTFSGWRQDALDALVSAALAGIVFAGIAKPGWLPGTVEVLAPNSPLTIKPPRGVAVVGNSVTARPLWPWALTGTGFTSTTATSGTAPFTLGYR